MFTRVLLKCTIFIYIIKKSFLDGNLYKISFRAYRKETWLVLHVLLNPKTFVFYKYLTYHNIWYHDIPKNECNSRMILHQSLHLVIMQYFLKVKKLIFPLKGFYFKQISIIWRGTHLCGVDAVSAASGRHGNWFELLVHICIHVRYSKLRTSNARGDVCS